MAPGTAGCQEPGEAARACSLAVPPQQGTGLAKRSLQPTAEAVAYLVHYLRGSWKRAAVLEVGPCQLTRPSHSRLYSSFSIQLHW